MHIIADVNKISKTVQRNHTFLMQLFPLKSLVFVVHFFNVFLHGKETFPKSNSWNGIVPLLIIFHLPYGKYKGVKICFYSCRYQNQNFLLILHSCRWCSTRVALVSHLCHTCVTRLSLVLHSCCQGRTRVAFVLPMLHYCRPHATRVQHSCCKLDQITKISYKGINKSNFCLYQLVIKRKEKQNERNLKRDDVKTNAIYFRTINYYDIYSCIACLSFCTSKGYFGTCFGNYIFYILDHQLAMLSRHILLMRH